MSERRFVLSQLALWPSGWALQNSDPRLRSRGSHFGGDLAAFHAVQFSSHALPPFRPVLHIWRRVGAGRLTGAV
jgi:hypothetical protein